MRHPGLIAWLGAMCKQAVGPEYDVPRPAETPAQARRAVGRTGNPPVVGVFQQAKPQRQPPPVIEPGQMTQQPLKW